MPNPDWHPIQLEQDKNVQPQRPMLEQQFPYREPAQVYPFVPPQDPSVDTCVVARVVVVGGTVLVAGAVLVATEEGATTVIIEAELLPQVPKRDWQPVPQWSVEEPQ